MATRPAKITEIVTALDSSSEHALQAAGHTTSTWPSSSTGQCRNSNLLSGRERRRQPAGTPGARSIENVAEFEFLSGHASRTVGRAMSTWLFSLRATVGIQIVHLRAHSDAGPWTPGAKSIENITESESSSGHASRTVRHAMSKWHSPLRGHSLYSNLISGTEIWRRPVRTPGAQSMENVTELNPRVVMPRGQSDMSSASGHLLSEGICCMSYYLAPKSDAGLWGHQAPKAMKTYQNSSSRVVMLRSQPDTR